MIIKCILINILKFKEYKGHTILMIWNKCCLDPFVGTLGSLVLLQDNSIKYRKYGIPNEPQVKIANGSSMKTVKIKNIGTKALGGNRISPR